MGIYLLKVNASIILFYLCYKLFFQRDTFWKMRRVYLLVSILFSFVYPLVSMEGWLKKQEPIMTALSAVQLDELLITPEGVGDTTAFSLENVFWTIFGVVVLLFLIRIIIQLISIMRQRIRGTKTELHGMPVIQVDEKITPFSFFKWIFINPELHTEDQIAEILEHELTHVRQWHSADVIVAQVQKTFCWFNPATWLMEREIRINLEYLADNQVLKSGFEPKKYQYHLLSLTYETGADSKLGNQFNVSPIKKRIKMMNSKKTKKAGLLKYALIIPVALAMLIISTMQDVIASTLHVEKTEIPVTEQAVAEPKPSVKIEIKEQPKKPEQLKIAVITDPKTNEKPNIFDEVVVVGYGFDDKEASDKKLKVYEVVEEPPVFPGGEMGMFQYLMMNIKYPAEAQKQKIEGRVMVQFVVNEIGKIESSKILRGIDPLLDAEALRVVNSMPNWTPGKQGGKNVSVRYTLPIQFKLQNDGKKDVETSKDKARTKSQEAVRKDILVVVDGKIVPFEKLNEIDPKNIENINVLKDKKATELYGDKGKNGVIIVTMRK
ncbi:MAG: TonB family protein [Bacteroidales bacterium]|nr:TonB family protein [Bacteroidales bacterium]